MSPNTWDIRGGSNEPDSPGLAAALRNWHRAERRKPELKDAPPVSVLPMTRAARVALELARGERLA